MLPLGNSCYDTDYKKHQICIEQRLSQGPMSTIKFSSKNRHITLCRLMIPPQSSQENSRKKVIIILTGAPVSEYGSYQCHAVFGKPECFLAQRIAESS